MANAADTEEPPQTKNQNMKTLTKLTLAVTMLLASMALCNAQGYHYVRPYYRHDGTSCNRIIKPTRTATSKQLEPVSEHQSVYGSGTIDP